MYFRKKTSGGRAYLQIVESRREGAAVRQQVIATLGRVEDLRASGQLERLLRSGARFAEVRESGASRRTRSFERVYDRPRAPPPSRRHAQINAPSSAARPRKPAASGVSATPMSSLAPVRLTPM
jgi:hypothetical protein